VSLLGRIRSALSAKVNDALDRAADPQKALDRAIAELEAANQEARKELLAYKTNVKQLDSELSRLDEAIALWEQRAMDAVRGGDDALAKDALGEKRRFEVERLRVRRERDELAGSAVQLNRGRKEVETRLRLLKLRKGTLAQQIAAARTGNVGLADERLWERMARAEERIDEQAIAAEVDQLLAEDEPGSGRGIAELAKAAKAAEADDALAALKQKMAAGDKPLRAAGGAANALPAADTAKNKGSK
jgi:phage shock protein A